MASRRDRAPDSLLGDEPHILLGDDLAPLDEDADRADAAEDLGEMPDF